MGLTEMQRKWYRSILEKDIDAVNGKLHILSQEKVVLSSVSGLTGKKEGKTRLMNMVMQVGAPSFVTLSVSEKLSVSASKSDMPPISF